MLLEMPENASVNDRDDSSFCCIITPLRALRVNEVITDIWIVGTPVQYRFEDTGIAVVKMDRHGGFQVGVGDRIKDLMSAKSKAKL